MEKDREKEQERERWIEVKDGYWSTEAGQESK